MMSPLICNFRLWWSQIMTVTGYLGRAPSFYEALNKHKLPAADKRPCWLGRYCSDPNINMLTDFLAVFQSRLKISIDIVFHFDYERSCNVINSESYQRDVKYYKIYNEILFKTNFVVNSMSSQYTFQLLYLMRRY